MNIKVMITSIAFLFMTGFLYLFRPDSGNDAPAPFAREKSEQGHALTWTFIVIALFTVLFTVVAMTGKDPVRTPVVWGILVIGIYVALVGLHSEAKRNLQGVAMFLVGISFIVLIISGTILLVSDKPAHLVYLLTAGFFLVFVVCLVYVIRVQYGKEALPNILRQRHKPSQIFEIEGVQFVPLQAAGSVMAGGSFNLLFEIQNCWDEERKFSIDLKVNKSIFTKRLGQAHPGDELFTFPRDIEITIPGSTTGILTVPVIANRDLQGKFKISFTARVSGSGGKRVRHWRAQGVGPEIKGWLTFALMFAGILAWGGGLGFSIDVLKRPAHQDIRAREIPRCDWQVLWSPHIRGSY